MKNRALKRIIAVVLCLVVFAGSELTGVTNIVGDLFAAEEETEADVEEQSDDADIEEEEPVEIVVTSDEEDAPDDGVGQETAAEAGAPEEAQPEEAEAEAGQEPEAEEEGQQPAETEQPEAASTETETAGQESDDGTEPEEAEQPEAGSAEEEQPEVSEEDSENKQPETEDAASEEQQPETEAKTEIVEEDQLKAGEENPAELPEEEEAEDPEEEEIAYPEYEKEIRDGQVKIRVAAEEGVLPEGTELSVTPIVEQDMEALEADGAASEEEIREAREIQEQFDAVKEELEATVADDNAKEIAHFLAYDISFYAENEDGESEKIEPKGDVTVRMEFEEAYLPESIAEDESVLLDSVDVVHMKETDDGLKAEVLSDAQVETTDDRVENAEFVSDSFSIYAIAWVGEVGVYTYEDDEVLITVSEETEGAIPAGSRLSVQPIVAAEATAEQYQAVADQLLEKAENEEYDIAGFLAYDITLIDKDGNKAEPNGGVKVTMDYKKATIPAEVDAATYAMAEETETEEGTEGGEASAEAPGLDLTVMHLEEDGAGEVTQVVDMGTTGDIKDLQATEKQEIQKAEFVTESFSTFVITWTINNFKKAAVTVHYVDGNGVEIPGTQAEGVSKGADTTEVNLKNAYATAIGGYNFSKITADKVNGTEISKLKYTSSGSGEELQAYIQHDKGSWKDGNWTVSGSAWDDWKIIHSNATAGDVYIVYNKINTPSVIGDASGAPDHKKYIRYNEANDDYTLTLDVTGEREAQKGVDILFVIDKSGSMGTGSGSGYYNLLPTLQTTIKNVVPIIVPEGTVNKVAAVSFSSRDYSDDIEVNWVGHTSGTNPVITGVRGLEAKGGTNWQLAMRRANNMLAGVASDNNEKIVIFMSDGEPTHYFDDNSASTREYDYYAATAMNRAVNEVNRSTYLKNAQIYSVYLTSGTQSSMTSFATSLQNKGVSATAIDGTNLQTSITNLINSLVVPVYTDVVIEDTLSEFVEFAEFSGEKPVFSVMKDGVTLDSAKYEITWPVDSNEKKFSIRFKSSGGEQDEVLEPDARYSISFKVKTTEKAEEAYRNNDYGYPDDMKGDDNTDAQGNTTSSGQSGFYSNELAVVKFKKTGDTTQKESEYPHPVVQVKVDRTVDSYLEYDKTATVKDWDDRTYDINIVAASKVTDTTTTEGSKTADIMMVFDTSGSMNYGSSSSSNDTADFTFKGYYRNVYQTLDTTKIYYFGNTTHQANSTNTIAGASYPMVYRDDKWQYYDKSQWRECSSTSWTGVYEWPSRLTTLKEAATTFATSTAQASPDSRIGVVTFNASNNAKTVSSLAALGNNPANLIKSIQQIYAGGGTYVNDGLKKAQTELNSSKREDVPQYIILFADGTSNDDKTDIKSTATQLKNAGVTIYTIGFGLTSNGQKWLSDDIASPGCALTADSTSDLNRIFQTIQSTITQSLEIKNAMIKDVIDPRFVILDDAGAPIVEGDKYSKDQIKNGVQLSNGGTVCFDEENGKQFIVWNEQTIPNAEKDSWSRTITVKAKEDYIGGNNVTTNISPDSIISIGGYGKAVLPQPAVNVKPALEAGNNEVTIFKGDQVPVEDKILNVLFNAEDIAKRFSLNPADFTLEWYLDEGCTQSITKEAMEAATPDDTQNYYLKVTYNVGVPTDESTKNTNGNVAGTSGSGSAAYTIQAVGTYKVEVISGSIEITKEVTTATEKAESFTFEIKQTGTDKPVQVTVTVPEGGTTAVLSKDEAMKLSGLSRGTYEVSEVPDNAEYGLEKIEKDDSTNCQSTDVTAESETITFTLGNSAEGTNVISADYTYEESAGGTLGKVTFTNEKTIGAWSIVKRSSSSDEILRLRDAEFTLTSSDKKVVYIGKSDVDGTVQWYEGDNVLTEKMVSGTYTLEETKAPAGFALSDEKWTIVIAKNGKPTSITSSKGSMNVEEGVYYYDNDAVYELPETGGVGIYWYMIGGVLLMMAGMLILYRNKNKYAGRC